MIRPQVTPNMKSLTQNFADVANFARDKKRMIRGAVVRRGRPAALNTEVREARRHGGFEGRGERRAATRPDMGDEGSDRKASTL